MTIRTIRRFTVGAALIFAATALKTTALAATSVTQFGITWTFDRDYPTGQFANGDYWVVGPVKITSISPRSTNSGGVTMNGSMINPVANGAQGYDSRIKNNTFSASLNVGASLPLTVPAGSSLLSSQSYSAKVSGDNPQLQTIAILTVLDKAAPAGSFRPPYIGTDKAIRWNKSSLQYSKLASLPVPANTPSLASVESDFERPWIEQKTNWTGRYMHPGANQPTYGRELSHTLEEGLLSLQLNYSNAQKEKLLVRLVQYGIDIYGAAKTGAKWNHDGGHNQGRKMPLLLAGAVLNDANILEYGDAAKHFIFQEDQQTWYVTKADVGRPLYHGDGRPREEYIAADVGIAEWGEKHNSSPDRDGRNWNAYYRTVTGSCTVGHVLTARLMGLVGKWNHAATFDYYDRYWAKEKGNIGGGANSITKFVGSMWTAYRNSQPSDFTPDNTSTEAIWQNTGFSSQTTAFTCTFDMVPSQNPMDGITGLSQTSADAESDLAASVRFGPSGVIEAANGTTYQAANPLRYTAGVTYRVTMSVDLPTATYSVVVTPGSGSSVKIADNYAFRSAQTGVTSLANVGFVSNSGAHSVLNVKATSITAPATGSTLLRVNAGGGKVTDSKGQVWAADNGFSAGSTYSTSSSIANTSDDKLFQTERYGRDQDLAYAFKVANGTYQVRLYFAEIYAGTSATGKRVFDVAIENKLAFSKLDIFARAGGANRALVLTTTATVEDGTLNLKFARGVQNPKICAIEVAEM